jgi:hypothetical protein
MAKNSIRDYANTAASNTDVQSINIDEGMSPANVNDAIRAIMADLADVNDGTISLVSPDFDAATIGSVAIDAFPSGTKMLFQQTSAPTGWTKDTTHNDKALRVVTGSASSGGTNSFSTSFASYTPAGTNAVTIASHPLILAEIPSHTHSITEDYTKEDNNFTAGGTYPLREGSTTVGTKTLTTTSAGGSQGHTHSGSTAVFAGTASTQFAVQYVDVIVATKD